MEVDLSKLNILITGASRGIGREITRYMGECGANIAIHYNREKDLAESLLEEIGGKSKCFQSDFSKAEDCILLFRKVIDEYGRLDVIVNNAGIALKSPLSMGDKEWIESWDRTMNVNLRSVGILCREAINHFIEKDGGRIINIASRAAFRGDVPEYIGYAASKGGIVALTRSIARNYGKFGIKAFIIAPGFVRTDMSKDFFDEYSEGIADKDIALNRLTETEDIAPIVSFLASGLADHATGCTIDINAGSYVH